MTTRPPVVTVYDASHANTGHLPAGLAAGYTTGSPDIRWTAGDWADHPGAVRICQDPAASDVTADVLDVESGAAPAAAAGPWARSALASWRAGRRPGQRSPAVYASADSLTPVANSLVAAGLTGIGLWVAHWGLEESEAAALVGGASGPFPVIGVQYAHLPGYDVSVFSAEWLAAVSPAPVPAPPGQWQDPSAWTWREAFACGTGLDGRFHLFRLSGGTWLKMV